MLTVDQFVEEFFRRTVGVGKGRSPAGVVDLLAQFGRLPSDQQEEITARLKRHDGFQWKCDLVAGRSGDSRRAGW